jgi:hypothetical protein
MSQLTQSLRLRIGVSRHRFPLLGSLTATPEQEVPNDCVVPRCHCFEVTTIHDREVNTSEIVDVGPRDFPQEDRVTAPPDPENGSLRPRRMLKPHRSRFT